MTSHKFYRDLYDSPFDKKADRRLWGYDELSDGYPGLQGAIHGAIGRVDGRQSAIVTGFAVTQTGDDNWSIASGYAYITGEFYELTPGAVTLTDGYYLQMSYADGSFNQTQYPAGGLILGYRSGTSFVYDQTRDYLSGISYTKRFMRYVEVFNDFKVNNSGFIATSGQIENASIYTLGGTTATYTSITGTYVSGIDLKYSTITGQRGSFSTGVISTSYITNGTIDNYEAVGGAAILGHNNSTLTYATGTKIQDAIYGLDEGIVDVDADYKSVMAIGSGNAAWYDCDSPSSWLDGVIGGLYGYYHTTYNGNDIISWHFPLPVTKGSYNLHLGGIRFRIANADSDENVVGTDVVVTDISGNPYTVYTNSTTYTSSTSVNIPFVSGQDVSAYYSIAVNIEVNSLDNSKPSIGRMQLKYYYE